MKEGSNAHDRLCGSLYLVVSRRDRLVETERCYPRQRLVDTIVVRSGVNWGSDGRTGTGGSPHGGYEKERRKNCSIELTPCHIHSLTLFISLSCLFSLLGLAFSSFFFFFCLLSVFLLLFTSY